MRAWEAEGSYLDGIRVLEVADELGEYAGKVLAGLGADVVKVEPPTGEETRTYGPFYLDEPDPNRSLHFWHYNLGKRSVTVDLDDETGKRDFHRLAAAADIIIDSRPHGYLDERGVGYDDLKTINKQLIYARISPFGDDGPWADYKASDLVHLALGGVMMNCGYDPDPAGFYETPPIAPQMWHAYAIVGEMTVMTILGALNYRLNQGSGQYLSASVHEAVSKNTETDMPDWVFLRQKHLRLTSRHSMISASVPALAHTKDGRYVLPYRTYLGGFAMNWDGVVSVMKKYGMHGDLDDPKYSDENYRAGPGVADHISFLTDRLIGRLMFDRDIWRDAQAAGLPWAPVRRPEENVNDEHWQDRGLFVPVEHPELGQSFTYVGPRWHSPNSAWTVGTRAPLVDEHTQEVLDEWTGSRAAHKPVFVSARAEEEPAVSRHGKPFALSDVRVVDLSWMLASAGAGRFLAAMGADVIKVEHESRWDAMRFSLGQCPPGGREQRDSAMEPIPTPGPTGPNRGGSFMEINSGKRGISVNLKSPEGRAVVEDLIRDADMVIEGFSPGTMERMGLGYDRLKELNPRIIYVQQSGFGQKGTFGQARAFGPTAQAFTGATDMSGLPEPFPPAGWGYSYLDWFGAYNMANAMLAALYRRNLTGKGCYIDTSQGEIGLYLTGTAVLDYAANGRRWSRYGNRSPYKKAAPHGAYRTSGDDRWIAISAFTDSQWKALTTVLGRNEWLDDDRFQDLDARLTHQEELDALVTEATIGHEGYELMNRLQELGVPAGVCQTAEDRYDHDPQLKHDGWLVELEQSEIGTWPVKEHPVRMSETPTHIGGRLDRSGPNYGEDTEAVLSEILGLDAAVVEQLRASGAIG